MPATANARQVSLAMNALSGSMTTGPMGKDTNTNGGSSSNHIDNNLDTEDTNRLDATRTKDSTFGDIRELETIAQIRSDDELLGEEELSHSIEASGDAINDGNDRASTVAPVIEYKVYRRRYFGLFQLVLLNIIVSWDWLSFAASSTTISKYYDVSLSAVNWFSTAFQFAFIAITPLAMWTLHRGGPKPSIIIASIFILLGNWIRYGATVVGQSGNFGAVMFGQVLSGIAQPFVLAAPTTYSDLWFTSEGRVAATAVMTLANPLGGALAQLVDPFWATTPEDVPNMVLYIAIISSVATIPSIFIHARPPTPVSASACDPKQPLLPSLKQVCSSPEFYMGAIPFIAFISLFTVISSLINQILGPYSFSQSEAGIGGGLLIIVGLAFAAIVSPIVDRTKAYLFTIKLLAPIISACYLAFIWAPQSRSLAFVYVILAIQGAASFSLLPIALELLIEITHPVSPEVTSTISWSLGQLFGGIGVLIGNDLRDPGIGDGSADNGTPRPPGNMHRTLLSMAICSLVIMPLPLALGCFGRGNKVRLRRLNTDRGAREATIRA